MARRVLLIEDNEQNRYLATYLLERHGYVVRVAVDGARGVSAATDDPPDLILLDIQLPAMDGYAVARALRTVPALRETPIIAVTSFAMAGDRERSLESGCTGYIEKPIDPEQFVHTVEEMIGWPRTEPTPA